MIVPLASDLSPTANCLGSAIRSHFNNRRRVLLSESPATSSSGIRKNEVSMDLCIANSVASAPHTDSDLIL